MTTTETVKLAACPFCGGVPVVRKSVDEYPADGAHPAGEYESWVTVACDNCGIEQGDEYRDEAIAAWNRRAGGEVEPVAAATEIRDLLHDLHSIIVVTKGEWTKQSAWSDWDQSVYERLLSAQAGLATTPNPAPSGEAVPVAPEGWVLVPSDPNATMSVEGAKHIGGGSAFDQGERYDMAAEIYRAMLAAAPPSQMPNGPGISAGPVSSSEKSAQRQQQKEA